MKFKKIDAGILNLRTKSFPRDVVVIARQARQRTIGRMEEEVGRNSFPGFTTQPQNLPPKCVFENSISPTTKIAGKNSSLHELAARGRLYSVTTGRQCACPKYLFPKSPNCKRAGVVDTVRIVLKKSV